MPVERLQMGQIVTAGQAAHVKLGQRCIAQIGFGLRQVVGVGAAEAIAQHPRIGIEVGVPDHAPPWRRRIPSRIADEVSSPRAQRSTIFRAAGLGAGPSTCTDASACWAASTRRSSSS